MDRRFFSVIGVRATSNERGLDGAEQPMMLQPEVGVLGFLVAQSNGAPQILVQAKSEPGNVGSVQLAPTVQATVSNYTRVHGGSPTHYLHYFTELPPKSTAEKAGGIETASLPGLPCSLQSEHGSRFIGKYNRNAIRFLDTDADAIEPANSFYSWSPLDALLDLMATDFAVNTDARSVLVSSDWRRLAREWRPFDRSGGASRFGSELRAAFESDDFAAPNNLRGIETTLSDWRCECRIRLEQRPLKRLGGWRMTDAMLSEHGGARGVAPFRIETDCREVADWDQPLFEDRTESEITLCCQLRDGVLCFLMKRSVEIGFEECVQLGPTRIRSRSEVPIASGSTDPILDELIDAGDEELACFQSDEGGRFHRNKARYRIVQLEEATPFRQTDSYWWLTLSQVHVVARRKGYLTNEARSAISLLLYICVVWLREGRSRGYGGALDV